METAPEDKKKAAKKAYQKEYQKEYRKKYDEPIPELKEPGNIEKASPINTR